MAQPGTELNLFDANVTSLADIKDLAAMTHLRAINLHRNRICAIECLDFLSQLVVLDLSSNDIARITGLDGCHNLKVLNLSSNKISQIEGLSALQQLKKLILSYNAISTLEGMAQLHGVHYQLEYLDLTGNQVAQLPQLEYLAGCVNLRTVHLQLLGAQHANPVCEVPAYKQTVLSYVRHLAVLDHQKVHVEVGKQEDGGMSMEYPELAAYLKLIEKPTPVLDDDLELDSPNSSLDDLPMPFWTPHVDKYLTRVKQRSRPLRSNKTRTPKDADMADDHWNPRPRQNIAGDDGFSECAGHDGRNKHGRVQHPRSTPPHQRSTSPGPLSYQQECEVEIARRKAAERSLEACTDKLQQQQRRIAELEQRAASLSMELQASRDEHAAQIRELHEKATQERGHLQQEKQALEQKLLQCNTEWKAATTQQVDATEQLIGFKQQAAEAESKLSIAESALQAAKQGQEDLKQRLLASDNEKQLLAGQLAELQTTLTTHLTTGREAIVALTAKLEEALHTLCERTKELDASRQENQSHSRSIAVLKEELDRLVQELRTTKEKEQVMKQEHSAALHQQEAALRQELKEWYEDQLQQWKEESRRTTGEDARVGRDKLQRLQEECAELQATVKEQRRSLEKVTTSSCRYRTEMQQLQTVVSHQETRIQDLMQSCKEAMTGREEALRRYEEEELQSRTRGAELAKLEGRFTTAQKRITGLEAELKKVAAERAELQYAAEQHEVERLTLQSQLETVRLECRNKVDCIQSMRNEIAELKRKLEMEVVSPQCNERLTYYETKCTQLSSKVVELDGAIARHMQEIGEKTQHLSMQEQSIQKLKDIINEKVHEINAKVTAEQALQSEIQQLRRELSNVKASLRDKEDMARELEAELHDQEEALRDLADRNDQKRAELSDFRRKENEMAQRITTLEAALASKEEAVGVVAAQVKVKGEAMNSLQSRLKDKENELADVQVKLKNQESELTKLQTEAMEAIQKAQLLPSLQARLIQVENEMQRVLAAYGEVQAALQHADQECAVLRAQLQQMEYDRALAVQRAVEAEQKLHHQKKYLKRMMGTLEQ